MEIEDLISIGFIKRPFGNDGFVTVVPKSDFIEAFSLLTEFFVVWTNKKVRYKTVEKFRIQNDKIKLKFKDVNSKQQAFALKKTKIMTTKEDLQISQQENTNLPKIIQGYKVFSVKNNKFYGTVTNTLFTAAHPIIIISNQEGKEILIPFIDNFVKKIDEQEQKILIETIPGLLDAN